MIVLDTHALVWWHAAPARLGRAARRLCERADRIGVSPVSLWEVGMLAERGRMKLRVPLAAWVRDVLAGPRMEALPVVPDIAVAAARLGVFRDPADRFIVATALHHGCVLLTKDDAITESGSVPVAWD